MRRVVGFTALILGFVLIFAAPFMRFYALPRVEKAPTDVYTVSISEGTGRYFDAADGYRYKGPTPVQNISIAKGDPQASMAAGDDVAVINRFSRTRDLNGGDFEYSETLYVFDRRSGEGIDCCGADPPQDGLTLKFPFNTERDGSYRFWDITTDQAWPATYVRDEEVEGLDCYVFTVEVPETNFASLNLPGFLVGQPTEGAVATQRMYRSTYTLWVEPYTGAVINGTQEIEQWAADASGALLLRLAHLELAYTDETVAETAERVTEKISELTIVKTYLPLFGPIVGIVLVVVGLVLLRGPRRRSASSTVLEPASAGA